jgi:isovaleryl-CoA dehydrogenase
VIGFVSAQLLVIEFKCQCSKQAISLGAGLLWQYGGGKMTGREDLDYGLGETVGLLRESVRGFVEDEVAVLAGAIDHGDFFSRELWLDMGVLGLLGITVPAEYGGAGMGYLEHVVVMEEISRVSAVLGFDYHVHSNLCVQHLYLNGSEEQKRRYLPGLISGELIGALAMGGAEAGPDVVSMDLSAERQGDWYRINGATTALVGRQDADLLIVYAAMSPPKMPLEISPFIVEKSTPGCQVRHKSTTPVLKEKPIRELVFETCRVPASSLLGEAGQGIRGLTSSLDSQRLVLAGGPLGVMAACLDLVLPTMRHPEQFAQVAPERKLTQGAIADLYTTWCACRSYVYTVARAADGRTLMRKDGAGVLHFVADRATRMAHEVIRLFGNSSQVEASRINQLLSDAQLFEGDWVTSENRRLLVAQELVSEGDR